MHVRYIARVLREFGVFNSSRTLLFFPLFIHYVLLKLKIRLPYIYVFSVSFNAVCYLVYSLLVASRFPPFTNLTVSKKL